MKTEIESLLQKKISTISVLSAFITRKGAEQLLAWVHDLHVPIRVLTGTYLDFTDPSALEMLHEAEYTQLRVYPTTRGKLHAKAYFFDTAHEHHLIIGSSNLTEGALQSNIEWNAMFMVNNSDAEYQRAKSAYEELWEIAQEIDASWIARYRMAYDYSNAFKRERSEREYSIDLPIPRFAQIEALQELQRTRKLGNTAALIVMATGLGKTHLAAFDSIEFHKILFVSHVTEILQQAETVFNNVRRFGRTEQFANGWYTRNTADVLFATVQKISRKGTIEKFRHDEFDYIIVDEFHHAQAKSFKKIIEYFQPKFLLGLTATPYRMDRKDISELCNGNIPYSCNMPTAIDNDWLSTFTYYGVYDDTVDYSVLPWSNGKYNETALVQAVNRKERATAILNHYHKHQQGPTIGFCVSIAHADYMTEYFNAHGVPALAVHSKGARPFDAKKQINAGEIAVIFAVNIFNEGIDFPDIQTVMFLRPTQSIVVFIQQLGRGLRKSADKERLIVIDFVGNYKQSFIVPALVTGSFYPHLNNEMYAILLREFKQLQRGEQQKKFTLPKNVQVNFDIQLIDTMLEQLGKINPIRLGYVQTYLELKRILGVEQVTIEQLLQQNIPVMNYIVAFNSWWQFLKEVGDLTEVQQAFSKEEREMLQWVEHKYFTEDWQFKIIIQILKLVASQTPLEEIVTEYIEDLSEKLTDALAPIKVKSKSIKSYITINGNLLVKSDQIRWEKLQPEIYTRIALKEREQLREFHIMKLYTRKQIKQVLINMGTKDPLQNLDSTFGTGIVDISDLKLLLLLVNLKKDKAAKETNINYEDYIIDHFHMVWESQNRTTLASKYGQIITEQIAYDKLMFIRLKRKTKYFDTYYFYLGKVHLKEHSGENPIQVTWRFATPLNEFMFDYLRSARDEGDIAGKIAVDTNLFTQSLLD